MRTRHSIDPIVLVAPHPDDEVFGAGALLRLVCGQGHRVQLVAVTDGEAAWGVQPAMTRRKLVAARLAERVDALHELGVADQVDVLRLGLPDGRVGDHERELEDCLVEAGARTVITTWRQDGHPDHEAAGRASAAAARRLGAELWEYVVWAELRGRLVDGHRLAMWSVPMDAVTRTAKARAARCFRSQLEPSPDGRPVVPPRLVERLAAGPELLLA